MIQYPVEQSEAEIQADIYLNLKSVGVDCRLEVSDGKSRYDIVIFHAKSKRPICIIEVKKNIHANKSNIQQYKKYVRNEIPVFLASSSGYDYHQVMLLIEKNEAKFEVIGKGFVKFKQKIEYIEEYTKYVKRLETEAIEKHKNSEIKEKNFYVENFVFKKSISDLFDVV